MNLYIYRIEYIQTILLERDLIRKCVVVKGKKIYFGDGVEALRELAYGRNIARNGSKSGMNKQTTHHTSLAERHRTTQGRG
jgi:hypothetical protein